MGCSYEPIPTPQDEQMLAIANGIADKQQRTSSILSAITKNKVWLCRLNKKPLITKQEASHQPTRSLSPTNNKPLITKQEASHHQTRSLSPTNNKPLITKQEASSFLG